MKESEIEDLLRKEINSAGGRAYKFISPGNAGVPDRMVVLPALDLPDPVLRLRSRRSQVVPDQVVKLPSGRVIFVELKTDKGRLSKLQEAQIKKLRDLGQQVEVVRGLAGLETFFRDVGLDDAAVRIAERRAEGGI